LNPQPSPFYVEGAEPGDTLAVHFISITHARDVAAATTVPLFGAMDTVPVVDLPKGAPPTWPRLESDTHITSTGSVRPSEDAFRIAQLDLVQRVVGTAERPPVSSYGACTTTCVVAWAYRAA
jgi:hypothetical protein